MQQLFPTKKVLPFSAQEVLALMTLFTRIDMEYCPYDYMVAARVSKSFDDAMYMNVGWQRRGFDILICTNNMKDFEAVAELVEEGKVTILNTHVGPHMHVLSLSLSLSLPSHPPPSSSTPLPTYLPPPPPPTLRVSLSYSLAHSLTELHDTLN